MYTGATMDTRASMTKGYTYIHKNWLQYTTEEASMSRSCGWGDYLKYIKNRLIGIPLCRDGMGHPAYIRYACLCWKFPRLHLPSAVDERAQMARRMLTRKGRTVRRKNKSMIIRWPTYDSRWR
jgi:hypothetical protein